MTNLNKSTQKKKSRMQWITCDSAMLDLVDGKVIEIGKSPEAEVPL